MDTVLLQIMTQAFISFQQLLTLATKRDRLLYETSIYYGTNYPQLERYMHVIRVV